jgi:hypothetical protein
VACKLYFLSTISHTCVRSPILAFFYLLSKKHTTPFQLQTTQTMQLLLLTLATALTAVAAAKIKPAKYALDSNNVSSFNNNQLVSNNPSFIRWNLWANKWNDPKTLSVKKAVFQLPVATTKEDVKLLAALDYDNEIIYQPMWTGERFQSVSEVIGEGLTKEQVAGVIGLNPEEVVSAIEKKLEKHQIPYGMWKQLFKLKDYELLDFIIDDSGSMQNMGDIRDAKTGRRMTRWEEVIP